MHITQEVSAFYSSFAVIAALLLDEDILAQENALPEVLVGVVSTCIHFQRIT